MVRFIECLNEWQTLVAGILAFLAAAATVGALWCQIRAEKLKHRDLLQRQLQATRAVLPADLSEICHYSTLCAQAIRGALQHFKEQAAPPSDLTSPVLPERVVGNLQRLIEHLNQQDADNVADMLCCYQVQHARFRGAVEEWSRPPTKGVTISYSRSNIEHLLPETVRLYLLAENMFDFSRRKADHVSTLDALNNRDIDRVLNILGFAHGGEGELRQRVKDELVGSQ